MPRRSRLAPSTRLATIAVTAVALVLTSCGGTPQVRNVPEQQAPQETESVRDVIATQNPNAASVIEGELEVSDQQTDGTSVMTDAALVDDLDPSRAWVVIYSDRDGAPAAPIGHRQVTAAATGQGLEIPLDEPIEETQTLWAALHYDGNATGVFEPGVDFVVVDPATGDRLVQSFQAVVEDG